MAHILLAALMALLAQPAERLTYPPAPTVDQVDDYHGTKVKDPYRWLEEYTPQTERWIEGQIALTAAYFERIPRRGPIRRRLTQLWDYERYGVPTQRAGRYFWTRNDGLQNQSVLYTADSLRAEPRVLLDPNLLSKDGTIALAGTSVTDDGTLLAYALAEAGSDWITWRVRDVKTGQDLPDEVRWAKFSDAAWTSDAKGFFYSRFDAPAASQAYRSINEYHKIYYHLLGTPQDQDRLIYERKDQPRWYLHGQVTDDGDFLVVDVSPGANTENGIFYRDLRQTDAPVVELLSAFDAHYQFVGNDGGTFYVSSDLDAPRWRVWAIDTRAPQREHWREVIPQTASAIESVALVGDRFFCCYLDDAKTRVTLYDQGGQPLGDIPLPGIGSVFGFTGRRGDRETFYLFTSFAAPPVIFRYDIPAARSEVFRRPRLPFSPEDFETRQVFCTSRDGTRVPLFVSGKKGFSPDGRRFVLLSGYGGFNISNTPSFSPANLAWMEMGGLFALANLRGGGEYGEVWHRAGMKTRKQNVFDDFVAAAEHLIAEKYTTPDRLAITGRSNGGLLVGACLNQRPDLFGAALAGVGVMDMLRFHKFTIGWGWVGEYGTSENPDDFKALHAYSPCHNIRAGLCYPPVLITTADHDDRVYPAHSFKYAAALQAAQSVVPDCDNPILIRIERRAGHGAGKPTTKRIEEAADELTFLVENLKMQP